MYKNALNACILYCSYTTQYYDNICSNYGQWGGFCSKNGIICRSDGKIFRKSEKQQNPSVNLKIFDSL